MISTKGRYALRVMLDLAQQQADTYIPLSEIAERQGISIKYLEIILKALVKENILQGQRGKGGGYKLTRAPKNYSVKEILELTEGPLATVACLMPDAKACPRKDGCLTLPMWAKFDHMIQDFFANITLEDLLNGNV